MWAKSPTTPENVGGEYFTLGGTCHNHNQVSLKWVRVLKWVIFWATDLF